MKRTVCILLALALLLCGCSGPGATEEPQAEADRNEAVVFPKSEALVGDTMPFFEDGKMNIFYLADQRDGKLGYHPWGLLRTEDYWNYEDLGIVLPYGEDATDQDIALGTGCVIKDKQGTYHAYFTGHNDFYEPKEAVMHATSEDMLHWTKHPEDTFTAPEAYSANDFRDPYVFYVESEQRYWMLVVTRTVETGVIVKYSSTDLCKWKDEGIFFSDDMGYATNMECPSLLEFGGKWYLCFSDQWPDRVVHYRIGESVNGPFRKPEQDTVDSNGFYAGRLETDGERLYLVGWNGTKIGHDDANDYDWGGNAVIHQLAQRDDGTLRPVVNEKILAGMNHRTEPVPLRITDTVKIGNGAYTMAGDLYELVRFEALEQTSRIEADISGFDGDGQFGFGFAPDLENVGTLSYVFSPGENLVKFCNTENVVEDDPQSWMEFDFSNQETLHVTILIGDGVATLYLNDELALTARMYRAQGTDWELFGINSGVTWENVAVYD